MRRFWCALLVAGLLMPACGDEGDDPKADDGSDPSSELSGDPIVVGAIVERNLDEQREESHAAAEAAIDKINAAGGIDGRPLEVRFCDPEADPNASTECAREMVADEEVMAIVGFLSTGGEGAQTVLTEAGMASIGNSAITGPDFNCEICFPVGGGAIGGIAGEAALVDDLLGDAVNLLVADTPAGQGLPPLIEGVLAQRAGGATLETVVAVADPGADVSAKVAAAAEGDPDGIAVVVSHDTALSVIQTAAGQGIDAPIVYTAANLTEDDLETLGDAAEGMYLASQFRLAGPAVEEFHAAMDEQAPDEPKNEAATSMWIAVNLFADVANGLDEISRESVLTALGDLSDYETGFTPPLTFTEPFEGLGGSLPRLFNTSVVYARVEDGQIVEIDDGQFADAFAASES